jgi:hypothetical protein
VLLFFLGLFLGTALAQEDSVLTNYKLAVSSLNDSISTLNSDSAKSLQDLQRAENTLRPLAQQAASSSLISDMKQTFERARTAVTNHSQTDLSVQATVLKGGFERLLYESALQEVQAGHVDVAQPRLDTLFATMGLSQASRKALAESEGDLAKTQAAFELGAAGSVITNLSRARDQTDTGSAYKALSAAYAHFITIQDSPHLDNAATSTFVSATKALLGGDRADFESQLQTLRQQMTALATGARSVLGQNQAANQDQAAEAQPAQAAANPQSQAAASGGAAVALPAIASAPAAAPPNGQGESISPTSTTSPSTEAALAEASPTGASPTATPAAANPVTATSPPASTPAAATTSTAPTASTIQGLADSALSPGAQNMLAQRYQAADLSSVASAWDRLYADSARAAAALQNGNQAQAKQQLSAFRDTYQRYLEPLVNNSASDQQTLSLLDTLENAPSLRVTDIAALSAQVNALQMQSSGLQSTLTPITTSVSRFWVGLVRLVAMLMLAILAFVPLRLLNLAFGASRNWGFVGLALFLLLLPLIYEGLCALGALLARLTGMGSLNALATYSIFQSSLSQLIWAAVMAAAIGFAWAGFHGICVQFGLLGKQRTPTELEAQTYKTSTRQDAEAVVDWDEEL